MTSEIIVQNLNLIVEKLMKEKGVDAYELHIEGQTESGDNYIGIIVFFRVITEDNDKVYNYVMKTANRSDALRLTMPIEAAYKTEIFVYSEVFPTFRKFIQDVKSNFEFDFVPTVFWIDDTDKEESLIFENLEKEGFKLLDRKKPWDLEHSLFVMEHYGKLHGLSLALKDQKPDVFRKLNKNTKNMYAEFSKFINLNKFYGEIVKNVMDLLKKAGKDDLLEKFRGFENEADDIIKGRTLEEDKLVITHGDCWNNNFMFKYQNQENSKPSRMCFLDFQLSMVDTPVLDLSYNIYTTCDSSCLDHFDLLLQTYHASLSKTVKSLGSDLDKLFTYEQLLQHWKKYGKLGVLISGHILKISLVNKEDVLDLTKLAESGMKFEDSFKIEVKDEEEYNRRVLDVFSHFGNRFL